MAKKRKKKGVFNFVFNVVFYNIFRGLYWLLKQTVLGVYKAIKFTFNSLKKKKEQVILSEKQPKSRPEYEKFSELKNLKGNFEDFEKNLLHKKSLIGIILGARGTGKSAIGLKILENIKSKKDRKLYAMGFKPETLPGWITPINDTNEIEEGSFVLMDEGGIRFSSRKAMSEANKILTELLLISRHKDLSILFISQNSANIEINTLRQADYLIMKPSSLLQKDFERKKIKEVYDDVKDDFEELKGKIGLTYIYSEDYRGFISNPLPSFWTEKTSKAFSKV